MHKTLLIIRVLFIAFCAIASWLICYTVEEWDLRRGLAVGIGLMLGVLVILVDLLLKGFSVRGLTAVTFGLGMGALVAWLVANSPLLNRGDPQIIYLVQMALFMICTYLGTAPCPLPRKTNACAHPPPHLRLFFVTSRWDFPR